MKTWSRNSSFLIVIVLFSLVVASVGCSKKEQQDGARVGDNERKEGKEPRPKKEAALSQWALGYRPWSAQKAHFSLNAEPFAKEFTADQEIAKSKYEDKVVELTGKVNDVSGFYGTRIVTVIIGRVGVSGTFIQCFLAPEYKAKGLHLSINQKVRITGGFECAPVYIVLGNCKLEELSKSEILHIRSGDLIKEFSKDPKAATEKYRDQWVIVSGEVEDLPQDGGFYKAKLKGDGKKWISVTFAPPWQSDEQSFLKKGQMVRLRGQFPLQFTDNKEIALYGGFIVEAQ
jgi:hypothetical protein